ncbi:hypothetical protein QE152_g12524 [Popillia japonica]|uniref:Uncharacterized protein n=1 Tax=Popillia japonica TaxID=7064 RepID=A0AAW1LSS9_POPJA
MAKYRNTLSELNCTSNSNLPSLSSNAPVNISETISRNLAISSNNEITCVGASPSSSSQITSGDAEPSLNTEIISEDIAPNSNNETIAGNPDSSLNSEILSEDAASSLDSQAMLDVASSSTCDVNINETNICSQIPDTIIRDVETDR